jgi:hypothetical protein
MVWPTDASRRCDTDGVPGYPPEGLRRMPELAYERPAHALRVRKTCLTRHDFDGVAALLDQGFGRLEAMSKKEVSAPFET